VYFSFDYTDAKDVDPEEIEEQPNDGLVPTGLSFNINYIRPHFFGLEAEPELAALIEHFSFLIDDPQRQGMGRGKYSREGFLRGWNAGNLLGYIVHLKQNGHPLVSKTDEWNGAVVGVI
jgi:hypothetical protein